MDTQIYVFDLDGTLSVNPTFYRSTYSRTLECLIEAEHGISGSETLAYYRRECQGRGELALAALNIPFSKWAAMLNAVSLDAIEPNPTLCEALRSLPGIKTIYTGSPTFLAKRIISQLGFDESDFAAIIGWQEPETSPTKWSCSTLPFELLLHRFQANAAQSWAAGDNWFTDILPAKHLGMRTALIGTDEGESDVRYPTALEFISSLRTIQKTPNKETLHVASLRRFG